MPVPHGNYQFGEFRLYPEEKVLFRGDRVVEVTPKAVDVLSALVENAGEIVSKEDIIRRVWPDSFVEEANLSHHIFKLRKALDDGDGRKVIETVPKRGYRFVAQLRPVSPPIGFENPTRKRQRLPVAIAVGVLSVLFLAGGWFVYSRRAPTAPAAVAIRSIAVMPFANESGSDAVEYLSDGMTETLINSLSEVPTLSVKSRSAVFKYKGRDVAVPTLGSELGVQAILYGRLTLRDDDLTLFLSLIEPRTENQIWGKQYVRKLSDLVDLQNEIGGDVAKSLEARLTATSEERLSKNYSKKGEAYRLYLLGDYYWAKFTKENFLKAKKYFEEAIAIDPNYALAYTGVANTYSVLGVNGHIPVAEARANSGAAAERAIQLDPDLAEAHLALGAYKLFFEWDLDAAENDFKHSMDLDPDYAVAHELMAYVLRARGRHEEAVSEAKRANELDPLNLLILGDIGTCYRFGGQLQNSIDVQNRLIDMDPNFADVHFEIALAYAQAGDHEIALREIMKGLELAGDNTHMKAGLGVVYARAGRNASAEKVIDDLLAGSNVRYVSPMDIALIYSALNDRDNAFIWLEKAYAEGSPWLFELNVTPEFDAIRADPRFNGLLNRMGLKKDREDGGSNTSFRSKSTAHVRNVRA